MTCTVSIREIDQIMLVELCGRFTMTDASGRIRGTVGDLLNAGHKRILLDLAKVTYLDSAAGIGELVSSYVSALHHGAELKLLRAGKNVNRVLEIVGLHTVFEIYDDEATAVRSFDSPKLATTAM